MKITLVVLALLFLAACAHPVLDCTLQEVEKDGVEYYIGPCVPAPEGKY